MSKDEQKAIKILKRMIRDGVSYDDGYGREPLSQDEKEACEMGIKALEQKIKKGGE